MNSMNPYKRCAHSVEHCVYYRLGRCENSVDLMCKLGMKSIKVCIFFMLCSSNPYRAHRTVQKHAKTIKIEIKFCFVSPFCTLM